MNTPKGFTLVEMAIVLVIVGVLLGGLLTPLRTQMEQRRTAETKQSLEQIKEALLGYALSQTKPHLPCPDVNTPIGASTTNDGREDFVAATGRCSAQEGNIPWVTLGLGENDSWGNHFRYRVTQAFSDRLPATPTLSAASTGILAISDPDNGTIVADKQAAVILSHGRNGFGAVNRLGTATPPPPATNIDELANTDGNDSFVSSSLRETGATRGEFDDLVTWLSPFVIFNRLVANGVQI